MEFSPPSCGPRSELTISYGSRWSGAFRISQAETPKLSVKRWTIVTREHLFSTGNAADRTLVQSEQ